MGNVDKTCPFDAELVRGQKIVCALSGGSDSVCLLHMLARERDRGALSLCAAHYHHGIRGEEADEDARFCEDLCRELSVPLHMGRGDVPALAREASVGLETAARQARRGFLEGVLRDTGSDAVALAHHADDNAETVLMHILRGAGIRGMSGMRKREGVYLRPLLGATKKQILEYLRENGIPFREDATNAVADNPRNILRLEVLPAMRRAYPGCGAALCRLAEAARRDDAYLEKLTDDYMAKAARRFPGGTELSTAGCPDEAILIRAVRRIAGAEVYSDALLRVPALCEREGSCTDMGAGVTAAYEKGALYLTREFPRPDPAPLSVPGETVLPGICRVSAERCEARPVKDDPMTQVLDEAALKGAVLRTRLPGDRIAPYGMDGTQSLGDRMTDKKIPLPLRDTVPVVAAGSSVLWAVGCGISRGAALGEGTRSAVRLHIVMEGDPNA